MSGSQGFEIHPEWEARWVYNGFRMGLQWVLGSAPERIKYDKNPYAGNRREFSIKQASLITGNILLKNLMQYNTFFRR